MMPSKACSRLAWFLATNLCAGTALTDYALYEANFLNASEDHGTEFDTDSGATFESRY